MGFLSGLTLGGLTGAVGRMARGGGGPFGPGAPGPRQGGGDLLDRLRSAMDPERLAIAQALIAGDYGAVTRMTAPLSQRRLARREELKRSRSQRDPFSPGMSNGVEPYPAAYPAVQGVGAGGELGMKPIAEPNPKSSLMKSGAFTAAGQDDPMTRRMATHPEPEDGEGVGAMIARNALRAVEGEQNHQSKVMKGINGYGYVPTRADYNLLARALFAEGRNTPDDMEALAHGIVNRIRPLNSPRQGRELGSTLEEVLSAPPQFSFWPNRRQPEGSASWVLSAHPGRMNPADRGSWNTAVKIADLVLGGASRDPTEHAPFFFASQHYDGRIEDAQDARGPFFQRGIRSGSLIPSPYHSPYPAGGYPPTNYFFRYRGDEGPPKR